MMRTLIPFLALALFGAGCDSVEDAPLAFTVDMGGAVTDTFDGVPATDRDETTLPIGTLPIGRITNYSFTFQDSSYAVLLDLSTLNQPLGEGDFPVVRYGKRAPGEVGALLVVSNGGGVFRATGGGTLSVTRVQGSQARGRLSFDATDLDAIPREDVRVTGEFEVALESTR